MTTKLIPMREFRRRLPHHHPEGKWLFVTWHLHGSLPHALYPPPGKLSSGSAFVWMDRYLDGTRCGPMYLAQEPIARLLVASLRRGVRLGHYELGAYAIMANHVHALLLPKVSPSRLLQSVKGVTARQANLILGRTGETFWQAESYDHWVRDESEWRRIASYIENNPVKLGLVSGRPLGPEDYRWSSAAKPDRSAETSLRTPDVAPELRAVKENDLTRSSPRPIVTVVVAGNSPRINRRNISQRRSFKRVYAQGGHRGFPETPGSRLSHRWRVEGEITPGSTTSGVRRLVSTRGICCDTVSREASA